MDATPSPRKSPFVREVVVDRDGAIAFLKKVGFTETGDPDIFVREDQRKTSQMMAGARYTETVSLTALLTDKRVWRNFVHRWSKKVQ